VPLHLRTGAAFRWRPTTLSGKASDVARVFEADDGVQLTLLANGYDSGFSTCSPPVSRLVLDLFVDEWSVTSGPVRARLEAAFNVARRRFVEEASSLLTPDPYFPDELPAATLLAVAVEGATVHMAWVGGDVAVLARGFRAITSTTPHTLIERCKRERPEVTHLSQVPNVLVRRIAKDAVEQDSLDYVAAHVEAGDTLLLLSCSAFRGPVVSIDATAFAAAGHASPAVLAERLAEVAFAGTDAPYAAVVAFRFDDVDMGSTLDRLIDQYQPDSRHGEWVRAWSQRERALPVVFDMGGILGMKRDGTVISVPWDEPRTTREETSSVAHMAAVIGAAQKYPELAALGPRRPADALDCPQCSVLNQDGQRGCPVCWHLGWSPPSPPGWFFSA
jgi:hypothetical protein